MKIIKPLRIGCVPHPLLSRDSTQLAITGLLSFDLRDPSAFKTEQDMWSAIQPELGDDSALDMGMPKVRGEVLLWGHAAPPEMKPVSRMEVSLTLGEIHKKLVVHGRRFWVPGLLGPKPGEPEIFDTMPLTYASAFGGAGYSLCPVGKGFDALRRFDAGENVELPNTEYAGQPILDTDAKPLPATFMPADWRWPGYRPAGSYDTEWLRRRYPGPPDDYNWSAHNRAPLDQQLEGYFEGGEAFQLAGFHSEYPVIESTIPDVTMRCFLQTVSNADLFELAMNMETIALFPSALTGVLLFRGVYSQASPDNGKIGALMLGCELKNSPRSLAYYQQIFSLRTGDEAVYHTLSDFELMPPISEDIAAILALERSKEKTEEEELRRKRNAWLPIYASAVAGIPISSGFFGQPDRTEEFNIPTITKADIDAGQVDMAAVKHAMDRIESTMNGMAAEAWNEFEALMARGSEVSAAFERIAANAPDIDPQDFKILGADAAGALADFSNRALSTAGRLEQEPGWPLSEAIAAFSGSKNEQLKRAVDDLLDENSLDESAKARLRSLSDAMKIEQPALPADVARDARQKMIANLRRIGEVGEGKGSLKHGTGAEQLENLKSFSDALTDSASTARKNGLEPKEAFAASLRNVVLPFMNESSPDATPELKNAMAAEFEKLCEKSEALFPTANEIPDLNLKNFSTDNSDSAKEILTRNEILAAEVLATVRPELLSSEGTVDWAQLSYKTLADTIAVANRVIPDPSPDSADDSDPDGERLRMAEALALGRNNANRFGVEYPEEPHPDEAIAQAAVDVFMNDGTMNQIAAKINAAGKEESAESILERLSSDPEGLQQSLLKESLQVGLQLPPEADAAVQRLSNAMVGLTPMASAWAQMRRQIPSAVDQFNSARRVTPTPLIEKADLDESIGLCVRKVVLDQLARGESLAGRDLAGADLRGIDLSGADLRGAFLEHADLREAKLNNALCSDAVFSGADFGGADCSGADFSRSNFGTARAADAIFQDARLLDAQLAEADFSRADLSRVDFGKCDARATSFASACLDESRVINGSFIHANFAATSLKCAVWSRANFIEANLTSCNAAGADFSKSVFVEVDANGGCFSDGCFENASFVHSRLDCAKFDSIRAQGSCWQDCVMNNASFLHADVSRSNFSRTILNQATMESANLRAALLPDAKLREATLDRVQFYEAQLRGTDFSGASMRHCNLHHADMLNASFSGADLTGARRVQTLLEKPDVRG